ncbi:class I SAM-dependent methyltransferase [Xanthomonas theicola]|uniref:SAM-dependent methyltransferase n=1 Tax=Xanthomonas theicola TaxID=56464 RepID=A0A2S6ZCQ1_9XANT|nr:methyltransferase domain-containing protein [Xanthomonas theicola]PPT88434.1 SAM-dependent methyltransferase [Xanthomonas theicola]QNH25316.1 methyltransferase domain-containing protein [Xanthomonas theicola]
MSGYATQIHMLNLGGQDYRIRSLLDTQQFSDPDALAAGAGISSAQWSLFGNVWPAGRLLAEAMALFDSAGKRILEIGCGLGLASLVLRRRGADILASDRHPLTEVFLAYNAALNEMPAVPYRRLDWAQPNDGLGRFDVIIGSDVLYEHQHPRLLAALLARHAATSAEVLIADPGRGNSAALTRALAAQGYTLSEQRELQLGPADLPPYRGRVLRYRRDAVPTGGNA